MNRTVRSDFKIEIYKIYFIQNKYKYLKINS
jgi:predicted RNA-binding protein